MDAINVMGVAILVVFIRMIGGCHICKIIILFYLWKVLHDNSSSRHGRIVNNTSAVRDHNIRNKARVLALTSIIDFSLMIIIIPLFLGPSLTFYLLKHSISCLDRSIIGFRSLKTKQTIVL